MDAMTDKETLANLPEDAIVRPTREEAEEAVRTLLRWAGDDPRREGLLETPKRVVNAYNDWFRGYDEDPNKILGKRFEDVQGYDDMVMLTNIDVESHCEHHMAPILGTACVAYLPDRAVVGISKIAKVVEAFTTGSDDPMANLRQEGEPAARSVRDQLDAVSPGLGNPVMPVDVSVEAPSMDRGDLIETMQRIEQRLQELKGHLQDN